MVTPPQQGLTLVELLTALVILSVLVSLAAPSFSRMLTEQRLRQATNELRISMVTARAEAIKRGETVAVLPRGSTWASGWCVESDAAASACSGNVIQEFIPPEPVALSTEAAIKFNAWGRASGCPQLALSAPTAGGVCEVCVSVKTDGRVITEPGSCDGFCPELDTDLAWAGACP